MSQKHILVVGMGSAGKRHARNLASLGCRISGVDPRADRRADQDEYLTLVDAHATIETALQAPDKPDAVVIASPPAFHVEQAITALGAGLPVLLEKPLSPTLDDAKRLVAQQKSTGLPVMLGYTWRWWPPIAKVRQLLADRAVGAPRHVSFFLSAHLADWHPWERYQDFFMAHANMGGGALLDESHWIDLMLWFFGMPECISASIDKISDLDIDSDDNVDLIARYGDGLQASVHLDLYGRPHQKFIRIIGEKGTILWSEQPNRIAIGVEAVENWQETHFDCERNDMFAALVQEFVDVLDGKTKQTCDLNDGLRVMRVIEAARESHQTGTTIRL